MPKLSIDGQEIEVQPGTTILQAAELLGIEIPRFCYHERLAIAGNCRMCLVEVEKSPKPVASCAMPAADGMVVHTRSDYAKKAREGVMEFLLINHPLDCPICDQGGECDLQDQAMAYGMDRSRYLEKKRAVDEKYLGPLIKTFMTRCIHCTRCVRFIEDVAGVPELGATGRGEGMEITTYVEQALTSELSANIIDLCPVGALTSQPYAFVARPWELTKTETIDVMDAVGSAIRVDARGDQVLRVLPRIHEEVNEEWISDKTRFACDGLRRKRLDRPWARKDGKLEPVSWAEALDIAAARLRETDGAHIAALAGDLADCESMLLLRDLMRSLGSPHMDCRQDGAKLDPTVRASYLFNTGIAGIEAAGALLIVGSNPRIEAPVLNARIRKRFLQTGMPVAMIGVPADLTYPATHIGAGGEALQSVADGSHPFVKILKSAERPMLILGQGALARPDGEAVLAVAKKIADSTGMIGPDWVGFNVLHTAAARVGGLDVGFVPHAEGRDRNAILNGAENGAIKLLYLLGADELPFDKIRNAFVIYQGHHGDAGAARADLILPGAAYTEKDATYVNTEGRVQRALRATFPPGEAREDWRIVRALSEKAGHKLPFDTLDDVRKRLVTKNPVFADEGAITPAPLVDLQQPFGKPGPVDVAPFVSPIADFYRTDPISRASKTMTECAERIGGSGQGMTGTDG